MQEITTGYDGLRRHGVQVVRDEAVAVDAAKKTVRLARGGDLTYERLVLSPGIDFTFGDVAGYEAAMGAGGAGLRPGSRCLELERRLSAPRSRCASCRRFCL